MKAIIMAGGEGIRLRPITKRKPKVMIHIMRKPVIGWVIDNLRKYGVNNILVSIHYLAEKIVPYLEEKNVGYHIRDRWLDTASALADVEDFITEDFIVANGDTLTNVNILRMMKQHFTTKSFATIFTHDSFTHCGGTYIFNKEVLKYIPKIDTYSIDKNLVPLLLKKKLKVTKFNKDYYYYDIGTREKLLAVHEKFAKMPTL